MSLVTNIFLFGSCLNVKNVGKYVHCNQWSFLSSVTSDEAYICAYIRLVAFFLIVCVNVINNCFIVLFAKTNGC